MMKKLLFFGLVYATGLLSCNPSNTTTEERNLPSTEDLSGVQAVDSRGAKALVDEAGEIILLDVRTPEEFAEGHLEGAINIDFYAADFKQQLAHLNPNQKYMVYCAVGGRSGKTGQMMEEMGFREVYNVTEGFAALSSKGIPVTEGHKE